MAATACYSQATKTFQINSALYVNATGIAVSSGQSVTITASGLVNISDLNGGYIADPTGMITYPIDPSSGSYDFFENDAIPEGQPPDVGTWKYPTGGAQLNSAPFSSLVAAISSNPNASGPSDFPNGFIEVDANKTFTASASGYLFLAVNDINNTYDNNGSFDVTVTIAGQPVAAVEFTQVIQQYQTLAQLKSSLSTNNEPPVPIIAGKPAVMRLYFTPVSSTTNYTVTVTGPASYTKTISQPPGCQPTDERAHNMSCPSLDFYFVAPSGAWSISLSVFDSNNNDIEDETFNITSRTTASVYLKAVAGCNVTVVPASKTCGKPSAMLSQVWMASLLLPTATVNATTTWASVEDSLQKYAYDFTAWDKSLARQAHALYTAADAQTDFNSNQWTDYFAVYNAKNAGDNSAMAAGAPSHGAMGPDIGMDLGADTTAQTVAHETGHTLSLQHTGVVVPTTPKITAPPGCYLTAQTMIDTWPFNTNNVQDTAGLEDGFNVLTQTVLDPSNTFDLMAYCVPVWLSPVNYNLVITQLNGGEVALQPPPASQTNEEAKHAADDSKPGKAAAPAIAPAVTTGSYWQIGGDIDPTAGVTFDPIFTETLAGSTDPGTGSYAIEVQGTGSQVLYTRNFAPVNGVDDSSTEGAVYPNPYFTEWVPVTAGATAIVVIDPSGNTIGNVPLVGTAPVVTITSPAAGFVGTDQQTISWNVQSSSASAFTSRVLYSPDGGTTWGQVSQTTGMSDTVDFSELPGSQSALIRVYVTDGVNTGSALSAPFNVPKKTPSTIVINSPADGYTQPAVDPLYLSGAVYDADDGVLTGTALQWSDNVAGNLGTGSPLIVTLKPGAHTITLTGTDSDGNQVTATANVFLGGAGPALSLTTSTLATNCVSATITAAAGSNGAPLSLVQYSLDNGSTYTSIPLTALPYSFVVPGNGTLNLGTVNVVAEAVDASHQMAVRSAPVLLTAACASGTPTVSGGSVQTANVGTVFTTPLSVLVSDFNGSPISGAMVNFAAPAAGASATFSPASATSSASGIASTVATANSANGSYSVIATVPGFSTTAQFTLTNTDFSLALQESSITIQHGSTGTLTVNLSALSGFSSTITLGCSDLPTGVTCAYSPATVTPAGSSASSTLTITVASNAKSTPTAMLRTIASGGAVLAVCLLGAGVRRRRSLLSLLGFVVLGVMLSSSVACSHFQGFSSTFNVTAASGSLTHSAPVSIVVQ